MPRKVDNSAGAGLNGEGIGDSEEALDMRGLVGGLAELFLGLVILKKCLSRRVCSWGWTSLIMRNQNQNMSPNRKIYASAKRASPPIN